MKPKSVITMFIPMLLIASLLAFAPQAKADTLIDHRNITSPNGIFVIFVNIYKYQSGNSDYYGFDMVLHAIQWDWFDFVDNFEFNVSGIIYNWQPQTGESGGKISLTPAGPQVTITNAPCAAISVSEDAAMDTLSWHIDYSQAQDEEFAASFAKATNTQISWNLNVTASACTGSDSPGQLPVRENETAKFCSDKLWDINHDGVCDIKDLVLLIKAYGSYPGHPNWNPNADLNGDNKVEIKDLVLLIKNFGKTC